MASLYWSASFFLMAVVAGALGFTGVAGEWSTMAQLAFIVLFILFVAMLVPWDDRKLI